MHATETNARLLLEVGYSLGLEGLSFDEDGLCVLSIDEIPVAIQAQEHGWRLSGFIAEVADADENEELSFSKEQWRSLLELNHELLKLGVFATLSYGPDAECVVLTQPLLENQLEGAQIASLLETFVFRLEEIQRAVDDIWEPNTSGDGGAPMEEAMTLLNQWV